MSNVWMSSVYGNHRLGERLGTRTKMYGRAWDPATSDVPVATADELKAMNLQTQGFALARESFPEAAAVYDDKLFRGVGELFCSAGFFVVRKKLATILSSFSLGDGGLIPFPVFQADLVTPYAGDFFLFNIGARKDTILIEKCENATKFYTDKNSGQQVWHINKLNADGNVVLSDAAIIGADLWAEIAVHDKLFMSDALASVLHDAGLAKSWRLQRCHVENVA